MELLPEQMMSRRPLLSATSWLLMPVLTLQPLGSISFSYDLDTCSDGSRFPSLVGAEVGNRAQR